MNPELTAYIQTQLALGVSKENIISNLVGQGGWQLSEVEAAFAAMTPTATAVTQTETAEQYVAPLVMPMSIKYFEWLMYGSFAATIGFVLFQLTTTGYNLYLLESSALPLIGMLIKFLCVKRVVYTRAEWARIILVGLFAFNIFSIFNIVLFLTIHPIQLLSVVPVLFEMGALYFLFLSSSTEWLTARVSESGLINSGSYTTENKKWTKIIPNLNHTAMVISGLLVFGLDLVILFMSPGLAAFYIAMIVVLIIFAFFYSFENKKLSHIFSNSESPLDTWFVALVVVRNIVFVLNFIPFIQLLGGAALVFGGVPYLIVYYSLYRTRCKSVPVTV